MSNHVHIVGTPARIDSLAKAIGRTNFRYTQYANRLHGRSGHLWQNRFFSCTLDEVHAWRTMVYVERNPVRAKVVRKPWRYAWSSASAHVGETDASALLDLGEWRRTWTPAKWMRQLEQPQDQSEVADIRLATHRGRPLASDSLLSKLERRVGRRLRPLPVGRPTKPANARKGETRRQGKAE